MGAKRKATERQARTIYALLLRIHGKRSACDGYKLAQMMTTREAGLWIGRLLVEIHDH